MDADDLYEELPDEFALKDLYDAYEEIGFGITRRNARILLDQLVSEGRVEQTNRRDQMISWFEKVDEDE